MLEVARLLASRRDSLRRGIPFAFWSGEAADLIDELTVLR
jgi:Zn-dependent M28 family amino/carboxypeptidase